MQEKKSVDKSLTDKVQNSSVEKKNTRAQDELDRYAELIIAQMLKERRWAEELSVDERFMMEHTRNQRRFEYDYEEDLYEPIYDDED